MMKPSCHYRRHCHHHGGLFSSVLLLVLLLLGSSSLLKSTVSAQSLSSTPNETIFSLLSTSSDFQQLYDLLNISAIGPATNKINHVYTLLAPDDNSFITLPNPYVYYLTTGWNLHATALASYLILPLKLNESEIFSTTNLTTYGNTSATIAVDRATKTLNGNTTIVTPDIQVFNGVIQIIDQVLIPPILNDTTVTSVFFNDLASTYTLFAKLINEADTYGISSNQGSVKMLLSNVTQYGWTLYVPTDAALAFYPLLTTLTGGAALDLILYHIAPENVNPLPLPTTPVGFYAENGLATWFWTTKQNKAAVNFANITQTYLAGNGYVSCVCV